MMNTDHHENNMRAAPKPGISREMGSRRALSDINNFVGGAQRYPCAVVAAKRERPGKIAEDKNPHVAVRRPMTRQFAASLARSQPPYQDAYAVPSLLNGNEKHNKPSQSFMNLDIFPVPAAIDVDDADLNLPSAEEVEAALLEVEMEDASVEDPIPDIDSADSKNPLAVVDYVEDIHSFYRQAEVSGCVNPDYMSNQADINEKMRAILIDWLIEVHYKFELMDETLFLTINIIDRFLEKHQVVRKKLQLVGVTSMLLACKYEEVSVPLVEDLVMISDRAYTRAEILEMERLMVGALGFDLSVPTPYVFMRRFLKAAQSDRKLELMSFFVMELCLVEYQMLKFRPSLLAAAAVYTAQCTIARCRHRWTRASELHSNYSEDQLLECSRLMVDFHLKVHLKAGEGKLTGVHRKYSTFKFGCAAKAEPALFLLQGLL